MTVKYRFPRQPVTVHHLGNEYTGLYVVDLKAGLINVSYEGRDVTAQISGHPEEELARLLLGELIDKKR